MYIQHTRMDTELKAAHENKNTDKCSSVIITRRHATLHIEFIG
jgi:hypothetical protein